MTTRKDKRLDRNNSHDREMRVLSRPEAAQRPPLARADYRSGTPGATPGVSAWTSGAFSRLGAGLASPIGILVTLPLLVALVGAFLTGMGEHALRASNLDVTRERMAEQARLVASSVNDALRQADPMLERLVPLVIQHGPDHPYAAFAHALADLMAGRPGVTFVSASFTDGSFQGAYLDPDGVVRFQHCRIAENGTRTLRFDLSAHDQLTLLREELTDYDPRRRSFYQLAVARGTRTWTKPYAFYATNTTGVTRTEPIYITRNGQKQLHAVVTVDFDVNALSSYLGVRQLPGMRAILYESSGTILAYAGGGIELPQREGRPVLFSDLSDPLLSSFFQFTKKAAGTQARQGVVFQGQEPYLVAVAPIRGEPSLAWSMAYLAPEQQFLSVLHRYEEQSFAVGVAAVLFSTLLAFLFARHITRVREAAASALAEAREARKEARELGSYRLVACLGSGGMGEVWRAQHRLLAREAAIKLIHTEGDVGLRGDRNARFRREAEALAALRSRNTIELLDYGVAEDGTFFLVTELLDGMDLESLVKLHGPQPAARVVHLMLQACSSLAEAHDAGLIHRDIKPANLFICRAADEVDLVKVLDFGLVSASREVTTANASLFGIEPAETLRRDQAGDLTTKLTHADGVLGTPAFMAPEQALSSPLDARADLYALGAVAFFLLTDRLLFEAETTVGLLIAHIQEPLPALRVVLPTSVPDALVTLLQQCLQKSPHERPASARELAKALRQIEFSANEAWTDGHAQAWWASHLQRRSERPPDELALTATLPIA